MKNWRKHCGAYNACGQRVYFVRDDWYNNTYAPRYRHEQARGRGHDERGHGHDERGPGRGHDRDDERDNGHDNGRGHGKH
jgi:hypothetical protein